MVESDLFNVIKMVVEENTSQFNFAWETEDVDMLLKLAKKHEVQPIVAYGLLFSDNLSKEAEQQCRMIVYTAMLHYEKLRKELQNICALLDAAGIEHMPLKGSVIRDLYPEPWMRTSGDIDILVKNADMAAALLEEKGYINRGKGSHDIILTSPQGITIELHFQLIETDPSANTILKRIWDYANVREGTHFYVLEPEMFYFYHIAHMAKHMRFGGCGVRNFLDIWVYTQKCVMDKEKLHWLLAEGGLEKFAWCAEQLSHVWFGKQEQDLLVRDLEIFVLNGGIFGSRSNSVKLHRTKANTTVKFLFLRLFMPYDRMTLKYPELRKYPILLPVFWIRRWVEMIFKGRKIRGAVQELVLNRELNNEEVSATKRLFEDLGLILDY